MSQRTEVLTHLKRKKTISPLEAFGLYGVMRLGAIIYNLRKEGYQITTHMKRENNKPYARYELLRKSPVV